MNVFISYRRSETSGYSGRIYDRLRALLPDAPIFIDVEGIAAGADWRSALSERIRAADVVLVLIGPEWRSLTDASGRRRLDDPADVTRWEIATALHMRKRVVPVLLDQSEPLRTSELPRPLRALARLQAVRIRHEEFDSGVEHLLARITGKRLREEIEAVSRGWMLERAKRWGVPAIAAAFVLFAWMRLFDLAALDTRLATWTLAIADAVAPVRLDERIVLIGIGAGRDPQDPAMRAQYAELLQRLASARTRRAVFDIHFHVPRPADAAFAAAMSQARAAGMEVFFSFVDTVDGKPRAVPELLSAATGAGLACAGRRLGYAASVPVAFGVRSDTDGLRASPLPALAILGAVGPARVAQVDPLGIDVEVDEKLMRLRTSLIGKELGAVQACAAMEPGTRNVELVLRLSAATALRAQRFDFDAVLTGRVEPARLAGKIAVIGYETPEETFRVAHGLSAQTRFGYELQAQAISTLSSGRATRFAGSVVQGLTAVIFATLGATIGVRFAQRRHRWLVAAFAAFAIAYLALAVALAVTEDYVLNGAYDMGAFTLALGVFRHLARRQQG